jgi:hypothetical protein
MYVYDKLQDHFKLEKLEKEKNLMKDLCRNRARKIKELEQYIKEVVNENKVLQEEMIAYNSNNKV